MTHNMGMASASTTISKNEGPPIELSNRDLHMAEHIKVEPYSGIVDPTGWNHRMETAGAIENAKKLLPGEKPLAALGQGELRIGPTLPA